VSLSLTPIFNGTVSFPDVYDIPLCPMGISPTIGGKIETGGHPRHSTKSTLAFLPDDGED